MEKTIAQRVSYIKKIRDEHGLSAEKICDIVSRRGDYISVTTVRRVIAKDAETKRFRIDTVAPIYDALVAEYGGNASELASVDPPFKFPQFDRYDYEKHIAALTREAERLLTENIEQKEIIRKQALMIDVLWHGLQCDEDEEEIARVVCYYKNRKE